MEERDREWFAGCKLDHTASFPYLSYDIIRTVGALMIFQLFLPVAVTAIFAFLASLVILRQILIERRIAAKTHSNIQNYRAMRQLVVLRATLWGSGSALALSVAPQALLVGIIPAALLVMMIDVLCMIAMPKQAVLAGMIHMLAIAVPLALWAQGPALFGAVAAVIGLVFMHWAVFNLHYVFATRRLRTRELENANDTIQLLLNQYDQDGSDWLIECDEDGAILRPNARFCKAADRAAEELDGLRLSMLFKNSPERDELRAIGIREEPFRDLVVPLAVEGKDLWWSISARPVYDRDGKLASWRGFIADVTRTHKAEAKVSYMAHYDVLTNLPNRSLFGTSMRRAFARRGDDDLMAVLYVDLDHFKSINDTFGHAEGDAVLAEAARRIEQAVGNKAMVARLGGDEFAVLLDRIDNREAALKAAQAIVSAKDEPVQMTGHELQIGASVGVAFAPDNASNGEELLRVADLALYDAKSRGRRGANLFDPGMQKVVQERRSLELDLRAALANGELEVFYQPLLSAQDTQIVGYEALLRWHHPTLGSVSPDVFIPIAEENGQIIPIGAWVLREALHEAANWPDEIFISVNLSPGQMQDKSLLNTVVGALASSGVSPARDHRDVANAG